MRKKGDKDTDSASVGDGSMMDDESNATDEVKLQRWRSNLPYIYDCYTTVDVDWSSMSICWGDVTSEGKYSDRQNIYHTSRTGTLVALCSHISVHSRYRITFLQFSCSPTILL